MDAGIALANVREGGRPLLPEKISNVRSLPQRRLRVKRPRNGGAGLEKAHSLASDGTMVTEIDTDDRGIAAREDDGRCAQPGQGTHIVWSVTLLRRGGPTVDSPNIPLAVALMFAYSIRDAYIHAAHERAIGSSRRSDVIKDEVAHTEDAVTLTPAVFHILLALADGERHGYGMMQEITRRTDGATRLGPGTLYRSIKRLLAEELIEESDERPTPALDDERRRYYRLTAGGRHAVGAEARRLAQLVHTARAKRVLGPGILRARPEGVG